MFHILLLPEYKIQIELLLAKLVIKLPNGTYITYILNYQNSLIREIIDTNNLLLTTPSKVTARMPLFSLKTKSKHTSEPLTPRKIELKKKLKLLQQGIRRRDKK